MIKSKESKPVEIFVFTILLIFICINAFGQKNKSDLKLWYDTPAANWNEALPLGNGRLGAMVFGIPEYENIQLNE